MLLKKNGKRSHGNHYEQKACDYLEAQKYEILAKNVNFSFGEIDVIAHERLRRGLTLVFVEVRKRDSRGFLEPEETVTFPKQMRLKNAIQTYLLKYRGPATNIRIDLIGFKDEELRHRKNFITY